MDVHIVGKHIDLTAELREAVNARVPRVERFAGDARRLDVDFGEVDGRRAEDHCTCELIAHMTNHRIDAHAAAATHLSALDKAFENLEQQLRKIHDRRVDRPVARRDGGPGRGGSDGAAPSS